jgi:hypothetical protein
MWRSFENLPFPGTDKVPLSIPEKKGTKRNGQTRPSCMATADMESDAKVHSQTALVRRGWNLCDGQSSREANTERNGTSRATWSKQNVFDDFIAAADTWSAKLHFEQSWRWKAGAMGVCSWARA